MKPSEVSSDMTMSEWLAVTLTLEEEGFKQDITHFMGDRLGDFFMSMGLAAQCELVEMMDECGWKTWSEPRGWLNRDAFISEAADVLHFVGLLLAAVGCTGEELTAAYTGKVVKNYARQAKGDDVRERRCSGCGRSLDDAGIEVRPDDWDSAGRVIHQEIVCRMCGTKVGSISD
jgi:hypothetical protein